MRAWACGVALATGSACAPAADTGGCPSFSDPVAAGTVAQAALDEASGLALSRRHANLLWTHNDDGRSDGVLYALGTDGSDRGSLTLPGANQVDWEDVAAATVDGQDLLFVGDIGDNDASRSEIRIWRLPEPETVTADGRVAVLQGFAFRWPDGARDAEALIADPRDGRLYVFSRDPTGSDLMRLPELTAANDGKAGEVVLHLDLTDGDAAGAGAVRGADFSPDGRSLWLRTDHALLRYEVGADQDVAAALSGGACSAPPPPESDGEAVAASNDGVYTLSEGVGPTLWRAGEAG